jgi:uncharacterized Zn finger protein (UPF0148 family)
VNDEAAYCPICRHEAKSTEWNTRGQKEYIRKASLAHLQKVLQGALRDDSHRFNAGQPRGGFIQLSMSYRPGSTVIAVPPSAADCLRQHFTCEACGCRYSSVGAAFFCPACGHNSATTTFASAIQTVRASVAGLGAIRDAVKAVANEDVATDTVRQILENGLVKIVASFQRYAEAVFHKLSTAANFKIRKNLFQNLNESSALWRSATGIGYEDLLDSLEMAELSVFFQQRHVLAHREGIVDQDYIDKSRDSSYKVGQKVIIKEHAVDRLADLVSHLAAGLQVRN